MTSPHGVLPSPYGLHYFFSDNVKLIEAYDRAGLDAYHVAEHHATPLDMAPSPNLLLSAIG